MEDKRAALLSLLAQNRTLGEEGKEKEKEKDGELPFFYLASCPLTMFLDPQFIKTYFGDASYYHLHRKKRNRKGKKNQISAAPITTQPKEQQKGESSTQQRNDKGRKRKMKDGDEDQKKTETDTHSSHPQLQEQKQSSPQQPSQLKSFIALSVDSNIDQHNAVCILPSGKMVFSVDKDMYQLLGLTGEKSPFHKGDRKSVV